MISSSRLSTPVTSSGSRVFTSEIGRILATNPPLDQNSGLLKSLVLWSLEVKNRQSLSAWDLRLQLLTEIEDDVKIDLARAFVSDHEKAPPVGRDVVRRMAGPVCLVWPLEEDFCFSHPERGLGRNGTRDPRRSLAVKELAPVASPDRLLPSRRRNQDPRARTGE